MPTIYIDVLLILNGFIDCLLLSAVAAFRHLPHTRWRLLLGGFVGAVSSLIILLPRLPALLLLLLDIVTAAVMVRCAFPFTHIRSYLVSVGGLFLLSALFSGLSTLLWFFVAPQGFFVLNGVVYYNISSLLLLLCTLICYGISRIVEHLLSKEHAPSPPLVFTAEHHGQTVQFTALHDTGFSVCDTFSGNPVILVNRSVVAPLLPVDFPKISTGFRLIPCHTVAGDSLLYAFYPDRLTLSAKTGEKPLTGTLLAVSDQLKNEPFDALCGNDIAKFYLSNEKRNPP